MSYREQYQLSERERLLLFERDIAASRQAEQHLTVRQNAHADRLHNHDLKFQRLHGVTETVAVLKDRATQKDNTLLVIKRTAAYATAVLLFLATIMGKMSEAALKAALSVLGVS